MRTQIQVSHIQRVYHEVHSLPKSLTVEQYREYEKQVIKGKSLTDILNKTSIMRSILNTKCEIIFLFLLLLLFFLEQSVKEVRKDTEDLHRKVMDMKTEYFRIKDHLDKLDKQYQDSKKYNPTQRYTVLKHMIKDICETVGDTKQMEEGEKKG